MDVFNYLCNVFSFYLKQNDNDKTIFGHYRVVAMVEKFYDILERIHSLESGHVGYKKLWQKYVLCVFVWGVMCCNQAVSHSHTALCI